MNVQSDGNEIKSFDVYTTIIIPERAIYDSLLRDTINFLKSQIIIEAFQHEVWYYFF